MRTILALLSLSVASVYAPPPPGLGERLDNGIRWNSHARQGLIGAPREIELVEELAGLGFFNIPELEASNFNDAELADLRSQMRSAVGFTYSAVFARLAFRAFGHLDGVPSDLFHVLATGTRATFPGSIRCVFPASLSEATSLTVLFESLGILYDQVSLPELDAYLNSPARDIREPSAFAPPAGRTALEGEVEPLDSYWTQAFVGPTKPTRLLRKLNWVSNPLASKYGGMPLFVRRLDDGGRLLKHTSHILEREFKGQKRQIAYALQIPPSASATLQQDFTRIHEVDAGHFVRGNCHEQIRRKVRAANEEAANLF